MKLFTPDDYVLARVAQYPSLYSDASLDGAKLRVFDQLFNVIGNGIRDIGELRADLKYHKFNRDRAFRAISGEEVYYGYYDFEMIGDYKFPRGDSVTALESEKANHPDVKVWNEAGNTSKRCAKLGIDYSWNPYPNFSKQYSILWAPDFRKVAGDEWVAAAIWYYEQCREWFKTNSHKYHGAYPCGDKNKDDRYLDEMLEWREKYESDEAFSEAYGYEYTGDMDDFMRRRSAGTIQKCLDYIEETIKEFS